MKPKFTIGIPTYNRANFLKKAIHFALSQTLDNIEIIVSDNASTDETEKICRELGNKIRYIRHEENKGMYFNFITLIKEAKGEFFSYLQDDDLIHEDFALRAYNALSSSHDITLYSCFMLESPSLETLYHKLQLYGLPLKLDWYSKKVRIIDGKLLSVLSYFLSPANPPSIAFRTDIAKKVYPIWNTSSFLISERFCAVSIASQGKVAIDPWIGALLLEHFPQAHKVKNPNEQFYSDWINLVPFLDEKLKEWPNWEAEAKSLFSEVHPNYLLMWYYTNLWWPKGPKYAVAFKLREILKESIFEKLGSKALEEKVTIKDIFHNITPPILWNTLKKYYNNLKFFRTKTT